MGKIKPDHKASITIQFPNPEAALDWFNAAQEAGILQEEAGLFQIDMLDQGQITSANEFIVRRAGSRGDQQLRWRTYKTIELVDAGEPDGDPRGPMNEGLGPDDPD